MGKKEEKKIDVLVEGCMAEIDLAESKKIYKESNDEFKKAVDKVDDKKTLEKYEEDLMKVMDEHEKYIREVMYELPKEIKFEDETYTKGHISKRIKSFLERHEVEFTYIYGLYMLCKYWAGNPDKIGYGPLDSTLRLLEQLKFSSKDWQTMMVINEFFRKADDNYNKDVARTIFLSERHNIILERMELLKPVSQIAEGMKE